MKVTALLFAMVLPMTAYAESDLPQDHSDTLALEKRPEGCRSEDMKDWAKLYISNPDDNGLLGLILLHEKLCDLVTTGKISEDRASDIFESWRWRLIKEWQNEIPLPF